MRARRIACLLLGLWFGAGLWMQWVASENIVAADNLLLHPSAEAASYLKTFGRIPIAPLTHYIAAEQNRALFQSWGDVQIAASVIFFFFVLFGTRLGKMPVILALLLVLLVLLERVVVIPGMNMVGQAAESSRRHVIGSVLNFGYTAAELVKWLLAAAVAAFLLFEHSRRSAYSGNQIDFVDKSNYRHIDR